MRRRGRARGSFLFVFVSDSTLVLLARCLFLSVCPGERSCRTGSIYGPANSTGCGVAEWWPHTPGVNSAAWCFGSSIATAEPCSTFTNSDACFASMPFYGCGWCSESTFGGGQCQKRNATAVPAQPQWMSGVVLPVCQLNATTGEPAFSFIDRCKAGSATRASCISMPSALGCGWCGDGSANSAAANASCQAATAAGFLSGMTCAAESFLYPAAGYVDPCKRYSSDCASCNSAPAELNCGRSIQRHTHGVRGSFGKLKFVCSSSHVVPSLLLRLL